MFGCMSVAHMPKQFYRGMTLAKAAKIRRLYFSRQYNQPQLAAQFNRTQATISRIISGLIWAVTS